MDRVVHFELPADDLKRAKKFYTKAFGWKMKDVSNGSPYTIAETTEINPQTRMPYEHGSINGGMGAREGMMMNTVITIEVDDIDSAMDRIVDAGGEKAQDKIEVKDMGWSAYFKDSEGNIVGLWQNK